MSKNILSRNTLTQELNIKNHELKTPEHTPETQRTRRGITITSTATKTQDHTGLTKPY